MSAIVDDAAAERFAAAIARRLGWRIDDGNLGQVAGILRERLAGRRPELYLASLDGADAADEWRAIASRLAVGETYFYRCIDHFRAFTEAALPEVLSARRAEGVIRILSAGCASGEEPYSLAMALRQRLDLSVWKVEITGVDMDGQSLRKARAGVFTRWSMRETPDDALARWFTPVGNDFRIDPRIASMVRFEERNVMVDDPLFWREGSFDVIFCRNLLIYLTPDAVRELIARFARALTPEGFLFLGHAETLRGISHDFTLSNTHECFYYRRRARLASAEGEPSIAAPANGDGIAAVRAATPASDGDWVDAITRSSQRVAGMAQPSPTVGSGEVGARPDALEAARELFSQERFVEAAERLDGLGGAVDPDALLLKAAVLVFQGAIPEAEAMCRRILAEDDLHAGAHFLEGLCAQQRGDLDASLRHARAAAYLDPTFAMPHLHLGVLARRAGERELAARELGQALALLPREDASRIALFGGGFNRDTLIEMCRESLAANRGVA